MAHTLRTLGKQCVSIMNSQRLMKPNKLDVAYFQTPLRIYINNNINDWKKYKCNQINYCQQKTKYGNLLTECNSHYRLIIPTNDIISEDTRSDMVHLYDEFQIILMSWKPGGVSPIHDHTNHGCSFGVLNGTLLEKRYYVDKTRDRNDRYIYSILNESEIGYINDDEAEHRIWNINDDDDNSECYNDYGSLKSEKHECEKCNSDSNKSLTYSHSLHIYSYLYQPNNINTTTIGLANDHYINNPNIDIEYDKLINRLNRKEIPMMN